MEQKENLTRKEEVCVNCVKDGNQPCGSHTREGEHIFESHSHINAPCGDKTYSHVHPHKHEGKIHSHLHTHTRISDIHSCLENELHYTADKADIIPDDAQSAECRSAYEKNKGDKDSLIALGNALCHQMRYNDAKVFFDRAVQLYPEDYTAHRRRAFCHMAILDIAVAEKEFLYCASFCDDVLDVQYRLACCKYYKGEYKEAMRLFEDCYRLCGTNGEMFVAIIYWDILCRVRLKLNVDDAVARYDKNIDAGHHIGYMAVIDLFLNDDLSISEELKNDELHLSIYYYGLSCYYESKRQSVKASEAFEKAKALNTYFSSFAYLGLYSEFLRNEKGLLKFE